jgi:hypothetical protein
MLHAMPYSLMAKTTCRVVQQEDKTYAVEMNVGRSVRIISGFASEDDARGWAARANLQEMRSVDEVARPERHKGHSEKPD